MWHNFCNFILTGHTPLLNFDLCFILVSIKGDFMGWRRQSKKYLLLSSLSFWQSVGLCAALCNQLCCISLVTKLDRVFQQTFWSRKQLDSFKIFRIFFDLLRFLWSQEWVKNTHLGWKTKMLEGRWLWDLPSALQLVFEQPSARCLVAPSFSVPPQKGVGVFHNVGRRWSPTYDTENGYFLSRKTGYSPWSSLCNFFMHK